MSLPSVTDAMELHQTLYDQGATDIAEVLGIDSQSIENLLSRILAQLQNQGSTDLTPILAALGLLQNALDSFGNTGVVVRTTVDPLSVEINNNPEVLATINPSSLQALTTALSDDVTSFKAADGSVTEVTPTEPLPVTITASDLQIDLSADTLTVGLNQASLDALENITVDAVTGEVRIRNPLSDPTDTTSAPVDLLVSLGDELAQIVTAIDDAASPIQYLDSTSGNPVTVTATNRLPVDVDLSGLTVNLGSGSSTLTVTLDPASLAALNPVKVINQTSDPADATSTPVPLTVRIDPTSAAANPLQVTFPATTFDNLINRFLKPDGSVESVSAAAPLPVTVLSDIALSPATITSLTNAVQRIGNPLDTGNNPIALTVSLGDELTTLTSALSGGVTSYRLPNNSIAEVSDTNRLPVDVDLSGLTVTLGGNNSTLQITNDVNPTNNSKIPLEVALVPSTVTIALPNDGSGNPIPLSVQLPTTAFDNLITRFLAPDSSVVSTSAANPLPVTLGATNLTVALQPSDLTALTGNQPVINAVDSLGNAIPLQVTFPSSGITIDTSAGDLAISLGDELTNLLNAIANPQPIAYKDASNNDVPVSAVSPLPVQVKTPTLTPTAITTSGTIRQFTAGEAAAAFTIGITTTSRISTIVNNTAVLWRMSFSEGSIFIAPYTSATLDNSTGSSHQTFARMAAGNYSFTPITGADVGRNLDGGAVPHVFINTRDW